MIEEIANGNVYDIGQSVNGVKKFLWFNKTWYYFEKRMTSKYEYDQKSLTKLVKENEFNEVTLLGNIMNLENFYQLHFKSE